MRAAWVLKHWRPFIPAFIAYRCSFLAGSSPVARLIRKTTADEKLLVLLNAASALLLGLAEACLFVVIYQVARLLTGGSLLPVLRVAPWSSEAMFLFLLLAILVLQLIASCGRYVNSVLAASFSARCQVRIIPEIHRYILGLSFGCASGFMVGDLSYQATVASQAIQVEIEQRSQMVSNAILMGIYLLVLLFISPWLLVVAMLLAVVMARAQAQLRPAIRSASRAVEVQRREINTTMIADIQLLRLLHSSGATGWAVQRMQQRLSQLEQRLHQLSYRLSLLEPLAELLPVFAAVLLGLLCWQLTSGRMDLLLPGLATFVLALQRLNIRLVKIGQSANQLVENMPRVEALNALLSPVGKTFRRLGGQPFEGLRGDIRFERVSFLHPGRQRPSLQDIEFVLQRNHTVALVGASGAGKSTIADLLVGLMEPMSGRIVVDGQDLQSIDLDSWRKQLGVVSQDVLMVHDTIAANIAFGMEASVTMPMIQRAAVAAGVEDFIAELPDGYETVIGEQGHRLSGGQRQRLSLARAMLRDPSLLILDEATSALDSHAEFRVHQAIQAFSRGRTVLAIAHRLSSIRHAQVILVLEAGRIVERGNHRHLLAQGGRYAALWNRQQAGEAAGSAS